MRDEARGSLTLRLLKYAHRHAVFGRRVRVLSQCLAGKIPPGSSVLDIGCGDGTIASLIKAENPGVNIQGIEISPRPNCSIKCTPFDGTTIPYPSASFDGCLFVDVLHHTHGIQPLLSEACRVSRRFVLIKDHLAESQLDFKTLQFMDWIGNRPHGVVLPYNYQSRAQWNQYFSAVGLTIRDWQSHIGLYPPPFGVLFGRRLHFVALLEKIETPH